MGGTRWRLTVLMLRSPDRVSRRLVRLLDHWPAEIRRHLIADTGRGVRVTNP